MMTSALYCKTNDMAKLLGYSRDYLLKNREILFYENIHYFVKNKRINWKIAVMIDWVENKNLSDKAKKILDLL